jgi:hypothetical protein
MGIGASLRRVRAEGSRTWFVRRAQRHRRRVAGADESDRPASGDTGSLGAAGIAAIRIGTGLARGGTNCPILGLVSGADEGWGTRRAGSSRRTAARPRRRSPCTANGEGATPGRVTPAGDRGGRRGPAASPRAAASHRAAGFRGATGSRGAAAAASGTGGVGVVESHRTTAAVNGRTGQRRDGDEKGRAKRPLF